jgi:hypothetical protein
MIPEYCIVNSVQKKCLGSYYPTRVEVKFGKLDKTKVIILKIIASLGTIATGLFSLIKPLSVRALPGWKWLVRVGSRKSALCWVGFSLPWVQRHYCLEARICF